MNEKETFQAFFPNWFVGIVKAVIVVILAQVCSVLATSAGSSTLWEAILTLGTYGLVCTLLLHLLKYVRLTGDGAPYERATIRSDYELLIARFFMFPATIIVVSAVMVVALFSISPESAVQFGLTGMGILMALIAIEM